MPKSVARSTFDLADVKNRIVERRMMKPAELLDHPGQWRDHTAEQAAAMAGVLREIGITDTLSAWYSERAGGKLVTWDGHLRKSLDPNIEWPVDITDLTDEEADYALATHDPLSAMALADKSALDALLSSVNSNEESVNAMLSALAEKEGVYENAELEDYDSTLDEFGEPIPDDGYVLFRFGAYAGRVPPEVYESFTEKYKNMQEESNEPMLADVLRCWLNV